MGEVSYLNRKRNWVEGGEQVQILQPQKGAQETFLSCGADIVIYGGAAGGGKTFSLLLEPLRHYQNGGFSCVIFRKNANQIFNPGGLWDASMEIYPHLGGKPFKTPKPYWLFPSGMKVSFAHLENSNDLLSWQGSQIALIAFDELTHFSQEQFFYMLSRNRSLCGIKPYVRATTNPDSDSWVADFIGWWIDQETGYAIPERSGKIRYLARRDNRLLWGDTAEDLLMQDIGQEEIKTVSFIAASLQDNQILMAKDPGYLGNLKALPFVEREKLLQGNWKVRPAGGSYFQRQQIAVLSVVPQDMIRLVRAWDFAATAEGKGDADYTAAVLMGKRKNGRYVILDVINRRCAAGEVRNLVKNTAMMDKEKWGSVTIRIPKDPGQAGVDQVQSYLKMLAGFSCIAERETGSKGTRAEPLAAQWQGGNVEILAAPWNESFLDQLERFPEVKHDDMVDAAAGAFNQLEKQNTILPKGSLSAFGKQSYWKK